MPSITLHNTLEHGRYYWLTFELQAGDDMTYTPTGECSTEIGRWHCDRMSPDRSRFYIVRGMHLVEWVPEELDTDDIWAAPWSALVELIAVPGPTAGSGPSAWLRPQAHAQTGEEGAA
jgi:hypothetical protein